jgi:hypothetical protein
MSGDPLATGRVFVDGSISKVLGKQICELDILISLPLIFRRLPLNTSVSLQIVSQLI